MPESSQQIRWACIAGAAEGLGAAFAIELAKKRFNLMMVDVDRDKLGSTIDQIKLSYKVDIQAIILDLETKDAADKLLTELKKVRCNFLVYNAAYGPVKPFLYNTKEELDRYIDLNIRTLTKLTYGFIHMNIGRKPGILFLSSLAGWRGTQLVVPYAATKAYVWNFAEGLHYEFKGGGVKIGVCVPGATDTPNYRSTRPKKTKLSPKPMDPVDVAAFAIKNFGKQLFLIPGRSNRISHFIMQRVLPRKWASRIHNKVMGEMYLETNT
jgi:hypothetical protein